MIEVGKVIADGVLDSYESAMNDTYPYAKVIFSNAVREYQLLFEPDGEMTLGVKGRTQRFRTPHKTILKCNAMSFAASTDKLYHTHIAAFGEKNGKLYRLGCENVLSASGRGGAYGETDGQVVFEEVEDADALRLHRERKAGRGKQ